MALTKSSVPINFSEGLDTVTDPLQVKPGRFLQLSNTIFSKQGLLQKRNGYAAKTSLPDTTSSAVTTFNGNLTAIGTNLNAYSKSSNTWVTRGQLHPVSLNTLPLVRSSTNQSQCDSAVASNGAVCTVFTDNVTSGGSTVPQYKYVIADATTGQNLIQPTAIPVSSGVVTGSPRVFVLGTYFVIVFNNVIAAVNHLQYVAVAVNAPSQVTANTNLSSAYTPSANVAFDGVVANNTLYLAWNGNDGGGAVRMTRLDAQLLQHNTVAFATRVATHISLAADTTGPTETIWVAFYDSASTNGYVLAVNQQLSTALAPTQIITTVAAVNITCQATSGVATVFYEVTNAYSYDGSVASNFIRSRTCTIGAVLGTATTIIRSVGLASKAFTSGSSVYMLTAYKSPYQPTYFLIDSTGKVVAKLAYSNGGGYLTAGLPSVTTLSGVATMAYLIKDTVQAANKSQGAASSSPIFSQTGINLASFTLTGTKVVSSEIGGNLNLSGGFLWAYDGYSPVENGFHLWPDSVEVTTATTGGNLTAQIYYYVATYEWSDNQGNVFRSAPSIPVIKDISASGTATNTNTVNVPTLRVTAKTANPVKIVVYRWSTAQQTYYQVTSIAIPTLNSTTTDSVAIVDTLADSAIIGNNILYTTGGVIENIGPPAADVTTLFQSRLVLLDSEDRNLLWYSKQVIEQTPVEMSDLLTIYVAPTAGAQGSTGVITALAAMDDKLIIFKKDAIYYIAGTGPDNTGANNQFGEPVFITSTVGCANQQSIVYMPNGLMFQSDKGIWLLGRDLSTQYIGAPVDDYATVAGAIVESAVNVPGTNEVRFTMSTGITLMYDYYFGQWGTFLNVPAVSSTLYEGLHTFINSLGAVYQETPGLYMDGANPVLISFKTSWFNLAGLQGYERAYWFYLLATYLSPHKLDIQIAYDYNPSPTQSTVITPDNYAAAYGNDTLWGSTAAWGGSGNVEQWKIHLQQQRCQAFQITLNELYDPSHLQPPGAGLTISGLNLVVGAKKGYTPLKAARSAG